jgi:hypothetical protein
MISFFLAILFTFTPVALHGHAAPIALDTPGGPVGRLDTPGGPVGRLDTPGGPVGATHANPPDRRH